MSGEACPKRVETGTLAWRCAVRELHEGPCAARESSASISRRDAWHAVQINYVVPTQEQPTGVRVLPYQARLDPSNLVAPSAREDHLIQNIGGVQSMADFPSWVQSTLLGQMAQASLAAFTALCENEFDKGAVEVVITKEFVDRLITPSLRALFSAIIRE